MYRVDAHEPSRASVIVVETGEGIVQGTQS